MVEKDLAEALKSGTIAAAGLDVLSAEPMRADNPLREIKDSDKLMITPHIAWASIEARTRLMKIIEGQIREFSICKRMRPFGGASAWNPRIQTAVEGQIAVFF